MSGDPVPPAGGGTEPPASPAPAAGDGLAARVGKLEEGQGTILGKLDQLLAGGQKVTGAPDAGIADEIRRGFADLATRVPGSAPAAPAPPGPPEPEQAPKAPVRKVTSFLWGED